MTSTCNKASNFMTLPQEIVDRIVEHAGRIGPVNACGYNGKEWDPTLINVCSDNVCSIPDRKALRKTCSSLRNATLNLEKTNITRVENEWRRITALEPTSQRSLTRETGLPGSFESFPGHHVRLTSDLGTFFKTTGDRWHMRLPELGVKASDKNLTQLVIATDISTDTDARLRQIYILKALLNDISTHQMVASGHPMATDALQSPLTPHMKSIVIAPFCTVPGEKDCCFDFTLRDTDTDAWITGQEWTTATERAEEYDKSRRELYDVAHSLFSQIVRPEQQVSLNIDVSVNLNHLGTWSHNTPIYTLPHRLTLQMKWECLPFSLNIARRLREDYDEVTPSLSSSDVFIHIRMQEADKAAALAEAIGLSIGRPDREEPSFHEKKRCYSDYIKRQLASSFCLTTQTARVTAYLHWPITDKSELGDQERVYDFWEHVSDVKDLTGGKELTKESTIVFKGVRDGPRSGLRC